MGYLSLAERTGQKLNTNELVVWEVNPDRFKLVGDQFIEFVRVRQIILPRNLNGGRDFRKVKVNGVDALRYGVSSAEFRLPEDATGKIVSAGRVNCSFVGSHLYEGSRGKMAMGYAGHENVFFLSDPDFDVIDLAISSYWDSQTAMAATLELSRIPKRDGVSKDSLKLEIIPTGRRLSADNSRGAWEIGSQGQVDRLKTMMGLPDQFVNFLLGTNVNTLVKLLEKVAGGEFGYYARKNKQGFWESFMSCLDRKVLR